MSIYLKSKKTTLVLAVACLTITACKKNEPKLETPPVIHPTPPEPKIVAIDGADYSIVKIKDQFWTAANYNGSKGVAQADKPGYGKFCTFDEAKSISVPTGWRLPNKEDCIKLLQSQGGLVYEDLSFDNLSAIKKLLSITTWTAIQGTDESYFALKAAGYQRVEDNYFGGGGEMAYMWVKQSDTSEPVCLEVTAIKHQPSYVFKIKIREVPLNYRFSVRFVKDTK